MSSGTAIGIRAAAAEWHKTRTESHRPTLRPGYIGQPQPEAQHRSTWGSLPVSGRQLCVTVRASLPLAVWVRKWSWQHEIVALLKKQSLVRPKSLLGHGLEPWVLQNINRRAIVRKLRPRAHTHLSVALTVPGAALLTLRRSQRIPPSLCCCELGRGKGGAHRDSAVPFELFELRCRQGPHVCRERYVGPGTRGLGGARPPRRGRRARGTTELLLIMRGTQTYSASSVVHGRV